MVAAPHHPLADLGRAATVANLRAHRLVVLTDSARNLPRRSLGLLDPGRRLVVGTMRDKRAAIAAGLGIGHLPLEWARPMVDAGRLAVVDTVDEPPTVEWLLAWQRNRNGRALRWLVEAIEADFDASAIVP